MSRQMKDSGIPWIGEIPEHWETDFIGSLYSLRAEKVSDKDYPPLSVTKNGIVPQLETAAKTDDGDNRKLVRKGDFAINSRSDRRGSCGISAYDGSVSLINTIMTPRATMNPVYYNWLFHTELFADEFYKWGHGIVDDLWTTRWQEMKRISIIIPPLEEQQRIADFLDQKCGEVDEMVSLQEKIIEELKAYKQAIITEAVCKGLNPDVEMKDSGVEWIGKIPEGWKMQRLKYLCKIETGKQDTQDAVADGEVRLIEMEWNTILDLFNIKATFEGEGILMAGDGAGAGRVFHHVFGKYAVHQRVYRLSNIKGIHSDYLFMYISNLFCKIMDMGSAQSTVPSVRLPMLNNFVVCIPSPTEQQEIAKYLDQKCAEIDSLIALKQQKIEELKDYKKSIIYEYITGKKEVV